MTYRPTFIDSIDPDYEPPDLDEPHEVNGESPPRIERFSLRELCSQFPRLNPPIIDGLIRAGETCNIIAASKVGKSWLSYSLALSVATGRPWLDRFAVAQGKVLLIDNELHPPTIAHRIQTVAAAMGIDFDDVADRIEIWPLRGRLKNLVQLGAEFGRIPHGEFRLMVLDAWYRSLPPDVSENDNAGITGLYNLIDRFAEQTGAGFTAIHHSSKGNQAEKRVTDVGSGAGSQSRATDCHLVLREHEEKDTIVLEAVVRSFPPVDPLVLRWAFPIWVPDDDGDPDALKGRKTRSEERQDRDDMQGQGAVLDALDGWMTISDLTGRTGFGDRRVKRLLGQLVASGHCEIGKEERRGIDRDVWRKSLRARD